MGAEWERRIEEYFWLGCVLGLLTCVGLCGPEVRRGNFGCTVHTVLYSSLQRILCPRLGKGLFLLPFPRVSLFLLSLVIVCPRLQYKIQNVFIRVLAA